MRTIITFETPSGTEWQASTDPKHSIPNLFVSVSKVDVDTKVRGMDAYEFEKRPFPDPRSPQALTIQAQRWGIVIGSEYAEVYCVVRTII